MLDHYVYFIGPEMGDTKYRDVDMLKGEYYYPFKVGVSTNPLNRLKQLQTSNFVKLEIIFVEGPFTKENAYKKELEIHKALKDINSIGEWFKLQYFSAKNILPVIKNLIKNDICLLEQRINEKKNKTEKVAKVADNLYWFRNRCWQLKKLRVKISYDMFWDLIDSHEFSPLKRRDKILIFLREFNVLSISELIDKY